VDVARLLGIRRVVAPVMAGVFCSAGMLAADAGHDFLRSVLRRMDGCDPAALEAVAESLRRQGLVSLAAEGYPESTVAFSLKADLRYVGQSSELTVPLRGARFDADALAALKVDFQRAYRETFGYANEESLELVNLRLSARGRREQRLDFARIRMGGTALAAAGGSRMVSFSRDAAPVKTPVLARADMPLTAVPGPMIVESYDTTVVVPPGVLARSDAVGNIILDLQDIDPDSSETRQ
jgi:N-methylhydantoinase A